MLDNTTNNSALGMVLIHLYEVVKICDTRNRLTRESQALAFK